MTLIYMYVTVAAVAVQFLYDLYVESYTNSIRDEMAKDSIETVKRRNVIQGMFRQHNEQFRTRGVKPPEGNA